MMLCERLTACKLQVNEGCEGEGEGGLAGASGRPLNPIGIFHFSFFSTLITQAQSTYGVWLLIISRCNGITIIVSYYFSRF